MPVTILSNVPWLIAWIILFLIGYRFIPHTKEFIVANLLITGAMVGVAWLFAYLLHLDVITKSLGLALFLSFIALPGLIALEGFLIFIWIAIMTD